jgi:hypothetical protein
MEPVSTFLWGCLGSVTAEVVAVLECYQKSKTGRLPVRYRRVGFWIARLLLVIASGSLAIASSAENPLKAFATGGAALIIVRKLAGIGRDGGPKDDEPPNTETKPKQVSNAS